MSRYIDAEQAIGYLLEHKRRGLEQNIVLRADEDSIIKFINTKCPTSDVAEVKHGFWEHGDYYDMGDVCSQCQYDSCQQPCHYRYCPNCGSKMDGNKNDRQRDFEQT